MLVLQGVIATKWNQRLMNEAVFNSACECNRSWGRTIIVSILVVPDQRLHTLTQMEHFTNNLISG